MARSVALIGARGYVGQELIGLLARDPAFEIAFATSREAEGTRSVGEVDVTFEILEPAEIAARKCDAYVLGLPNGLSAPYVEAIDTVVPKSVILDLSTDHRHKNGWSYGLPEISESLPFPSRVANPGCYATAGILSLWPLRDQLAGAPTVVGMSGYSGAGTTPSDKNDPDRLRDNILPYGFRGHAHQDEMSIALGHNITFAPHVMPFFRGLLVTVAAPLKSFISESEIEDRFRSIYQSSEVIRIQSEPPEPQSVAGTPYACLGGFAVHPETNVLTLSCALDNLLKGAASQAVANLHRAFKS